MTCRVARMSQVLPLINMAFCCECSSADLEMCYTSKALGPHLCPICAQFKVENGTWKDNQARSSDEGAACRLTQVNLEYASRNQKEDLCSVNAAGDYSSMKPSAT